jgi:hypothetical protein
VIDWESVRLACEHIGAARVVVYDSPDETAALVKFILIQSPELSSQIQRVHGLRTQPDACRIVVQYQVMSEEELAAFDTLVRLHGEHTAIVTMCGDPKEALR